MRIRSRKVLVGALLSVFGLSIVLIWAICSGNQDDPTISISFLSYTNQGTSARLKITNVGKIAVRRESHYTVYWTSPDKPIQNSDALFLNTRKLPPGDLEVVTVVVPKDAKSWNTTLLFTIQRDPFGRGLAWLESRIRWTLLREPGGRFDRLYGFKSPEVAGAADR